MSYLAAQSNSRRSDQTLGVQIGKVTRVTGSKCWYSVDKGWERGPALIPWDILNAETVKVSGSGPTLTVTVTPKPLTVGSTVAVQATRAGQFVLARY